MIDSDYQVEPFWLRRAMPYFAAPSVALVQGPQDYRDAQDSLFKAMAYEEYRGFFHIGMVERNEHNAIIQHGTMTIVAKTALAEVDGWSEWCITEDTELGMKLFEAGYDAAYIPQSMGHGLEPDTLEAFMSQRYRWTYGAMQMLKRHARDIFLGSSGLSWQQRYQFLSGWLPWISDGLGMVVTLTAICWTLLMWLIPTYIDVPMPALSAAAMSLFATKLLKTLLLYPPMVKSGLKGAVYASVAGLSLTHTVGKAVWTGLFTRGKPFLRTPKCADPRPRAARPWCGRRCDGDAGRAGVALRRHFRHRPGQCPVQPRRRGGFAGAAGPAGSDGSRLKRALSKAGRHPI